MGISIKQEGEMHKAKDNTEVSFFFFISSIIPVRKRKLNLRSELAKSAKEERATEQFYRISNAGSVVDIR